MFRPGWDFLPFLPNRSNDASFDSGEPMNIGEIVASVTKSHLKSDIPVMDIGDTLNVHCRIIEGSKERIQVFQGVLISRAGAGINEFFAVRRIVDNQGVERIFPIHSPKVAKIEVVRRGDSRRAKLYFLRDRIGKSRRLRDRRRGIKHVKDLPTVAP
jgi:large subunit ribosomal protein L19